jgi:HD domain
MRTLTAVAGIDRARELAAGHLAPVLPRRWRHVQGVAARATEVAAHIGEGDGILVSAAWLHDVGYGPDLAATGFHPLDGARYLTALGAPKRLADLVAHHSYAVLEGRLRGLASEMTAFEDEQTAVRDALWYCDLTTSPDGGRVSAGDRLAEIKRRYGPGHVVSRFITAGAAELLAAVHRTEQRLAGPRAS